MRTEWFDLKRKFFFGWSLSVMQALSSLALLATSAWLLSRADQRPAVMYLSIAVVGVRAFALGKAFFRYSERLVLHDATFRKATKLRTGIYEKLVERAPIGLSDVTVGSLLTTLVDDTEESLNEDLRFRPVFIQSIAVTVAGASLYFWLAPSFAWVMLLVLSLGATFTFLGARKTFGRNLARLSDLRTQLADLSNSLVSRARVIQAFGWQERSIDKLDELSLQVAKLEKRVATSTGLLQSFISIATYLSILAAAIVSITSGELLPGEQVAVLVLLPLGIYEYLQALPNAVQAQSKAKVAIQRLEELNSATIPEELRDTGSRILEKFESLEISSAVVTYPDGSTVSLPELNLKAGESLSLVAKSGAGKSTLANVLVGFIRPSIGKFELNNVSIESFDPNSLRATIGLVEQQPMILAGTVRSNLILAKPVATEVELVSLLQDVGLWRMLMKREGLDTEVGIAGARLSGGEAQRLGLARNLLARRELIILDEPTSSVTQKQGIELVKQFLDLAKQRNVSILLISHDPNLAELTDRLVQF